MSRTTKCFSHLSILLDSCNYPCGGTLHEALYNRIRFVIFGLSLLSMCWCDIGVAEQLQAKATPGVASEAPEEGEVTTGKSANKNPVRLLLPPIIHAVPGVECNVYFENIALVNRLEDVLFDAECQRGQNQRERWTWTPTENDVGDVALKITVRDPENQSLGEAKTVIRVCRPDAGAGRNISLLCIGDSLTHASIYPAKLLELSKGGSHPQLQLIGSHQPGDNPAIRHEGYGGWTALRFATHFSEVSRTGPAQQRGSPFLYASPDGPPRLDFPRYCKDINGGKYPDLVTVFLGPNDIFSLQDDTLESGTDVILKQMDAIVQMVLSSNEKTRIGMMLPVPPAATQDAFGSNYASGQTRWQYKRNQHRLVERMIERFGRPELRRVELIPTVVNLDCYWNYPAAEVPVNARNTVKVRRLINGVHPSVEGYHQIADSVFAWIKSQ